MRVRRAASTSADFCTIAQVGIGGFIRSFGTAAAILAVSALHAGGAGIVLPDSEYTVTHWQIEQGLPDMTVSAMAETRDGYLWFGTFDGLVRFNGVEFRVFRPADTPALPDPGIVNLHLDRSGRLWISTVKGMATFKDGAWQSFAGNSGWTGNYVRHWAETPRGELFMSTFDGKILKATGDRFLELPTPPGDYRPYHFLFADRAGELNCIRGGAWNVWRDGAWTSRKLPPEIAARTWPLAFSSARDGGLWVVNGDRIWKLGDSGIELRRQTSHPMQSIWSINETPDGDLWVASYARGLFRVKPDGSQRWMHKASGLPGDRFRFAQADRKGTFWVGMSGDGLLRLRERRFRDHRGDAWIEDSAIRSIVRGPRGSLLVATYGGGIYTQSGDSMTWRKEAGRLYATAVLLDRRGRLWTGSDQGGLQIHDGGRMRAENCCGISIRAIYEDSRGAVWIAGDQRLARVEGETLTTFPLPAPLAGTPIQTFVEHPVTRRLWAAGEAGLYRFDGSGFVEVRDASGGRILNLTSLLFAPEGRMWLGTTDRGLLHFHDGRVTEIDARAGLAATRVVGMAVAREDLWLATNRGVWHARETDVRGYIDGRRDDVGWQVFDQMDGLPAAAGSTGHQTMLLDDAGRIWIATMRGLASIDPGRLPPPVPGIPVRAEAFSYLDPNLETRSPSIGPREGLRLEPGSRNIRFAYSALETIDPAKVLFEYVLRKDEQVVSRGRTDESSLFFPYLAPGRYRLEVSARNSDGVWSPAPAVQQFEVEPAFLERTPVIAALAVLALIGAGCGTWWIARQRLRREREALAREKEMNEVRARSALVLEITSDAVWFESPARAITFMNNAARRLFGLGPDANPEAASGSDILRERVIVDQALPAVYRDGVWENYVSIQGGSRTLWLRLTAHWAADGAIEFISARAHDVTGLKAAEEALRMSEEKFSKAFHATPDALVILELGGGVIVEVNEGFERTFGIDAARAAGKTIADLGLLGAPEAGRAFLDELAEKGRILDREYPFNRLDGGTGTALVRAERFTVGGRLLALSVFHDLTNRLQMEEQVRQSQKMDSVGRLAGGIAHDFNNLLTVINGYSTFLLRTVPPGDAAYKMAEEIGKAGARAASLTRQLLAFSRSQVIEPRPVDVNALIRDNAEMLSRLLREDIRLDIRLLAESAWVMADPTNIHQVLINLAANARDAMPEGGQLSIITRDGEPAPLLLLIVSDTGVGMTEDVRRRAFDPFFTTKPEGAGTGLGLSTVYGIVRQCGGWIRIDSQAGSGAAVTIGLPAVGSTAVAPREEIRRHDWTGTETVLVVEDQDDVRAMVIAILSGLGYRTLEAGGGAEAIAVASRHPDPIHLLLTDVVMPHMNGKEVAARIRAVRPGMRVLFMSGYTDESLMNGGRLDPGTAAIAKPFGPDDLAKKVREILSAESALT